MEAIEQTTWLLPEEYPVRVITMRSGDETEHLRRNGLIHADAYRGSTIPAQQASDSTIPVPLKVHAESRPTLKCTQNNSPYARRHFCI
jgi:hypothetical protein